MMIDGGIILVALAGALWGATNPYLKKYTEGFVSSGKANDDRPSEGITASSSSLMADAKFLIHRPRYLMVQGLNLLGSVIFAVGMSSASLSVGPAVANGLSMAITCLISSFVLHEEGMTYKTVLGVALIFGGILVSVTA